MLYKVQSVKRLEKYVKIPGNMAIVELKASIMSAINEGIIKTYSRSSFHFMDVTWQIIADSPEIADFFTAEYKHFHSKPAVSHATPLQVTIQFLKLSKDRSRPAYGQIQTSVCGIRFSKKKRVYIYRDKSFVNDYVQDTRRILRFFYSDPSTAQEEGNRLLLSSVGEFLEHRGLVRLHACGFLNENLAMIFPGDSGFGKSTFAKDVLHSTDHKILSDEMILTNGQEFFPFPLRISMKEPFSSTVFSVDEWSRRNNPTKWQIQIPAERVVTQPSAGRIYLGPDMGLFKFCVRVVSGYGIAQMKEYFIRGDNFFMLVKFFIRRCYVFFRLVSVCKKIDIKPRQSQKWLGLLTKG
jgi:hypothetical protein